jgi:hypothetical protein
MRTWTPLMIAALAGAVFTSVLPSADAQHAMPPRRPEGRRRIGWPRRVRRPSRRIIATGRGFGMAFAADENGYPGPLHILELKDRLKLTAEQETKAEMMMAAVEKARAPTCARLTSWPT